MRGPGSHPHPRLILFIYFYLVFFSTFYFNKYNKEAVGPTSCRAGKAHLHRRAFTGELGAPWDRAPQAEGQCSFSVLRPTTETPGRSTPAPRSHSYPARSLTGGLWRFGPGQGPRDCPPRHTPRSPILPRQARPAALQAAGARRPAPKRGSPPSRISPGGHPLPEPRTRARPGLGGRGAGGPRRPAPGALWWPPRARSGSAGSPHNAAGRGRRQPGIPPASEGVWASRPRAPFSPRRKHFWMELNFCKKINEVDKRHLVYNTGETPSRSGPAGRSQGEPRRAEMVPIVAAARGSARATGRGARPRGPGRGGGGGGGERGGAPQGPHQLPLPFVRREPHPSAPAASPARVPAAFRDSPLAGEKSRRL